MVHDMTSGNAFRQIVAFSIPLMIGNLFQQFYSIADTVIVGRILGDEALAAVGATSAITFLIIGFLGGMAEGSCILIARFFGAGDERKMKRCVGNMIYVCGAVTILLTAGAILFNRPILALLKTPDNIIGMSQEYLFYIYAGMFATMLYNVFAGLLRALGDSRSPLYFLLISSALNIGLDLLFVLPLGMGIAGAAIATVLSQLVSALLCFVYILNRCPLLRIGRADLAPDGSLIRSLCGMGLPMALQYSVTAVGSIILQGAVNPLGSDAVAAMTVASKCEGVGWSFMNSIGTACANFSSQNIGAGRLDRVRHGMRVGVLIETVISAVVTFIFCVFPTPIVRLFLGDAENVIPYATQAVVTKSAFFLALSLILLFRATIQGIGYSIPAMFAGLVELVGRSSIALIFVPLYGFDAVCYATPVAWVMADLFLLPLYFIAIRRITRRTELSSTPAA